ncbi:hypothetical protein GCM10012319_26940 [Comamonas sp. KCTC 72670]|nr:hypothetical protein GCM10012319_26940 [Comamonas sp. KCTC 72670]
MKSGGVASLAQASGADKSHRRLGRAWKDGGTWAREGRLAGAVRVSDTACSRISAPLRTGRPRLTDRDTQVIPLRVCMAGTLRQVSMPPRRGVVAAALSHGKECFCSISRRTRMSADVFSSRQPSAVPALQPVASPVPL